MVAPLPKSMKGFALIINLVYNAAMKRPRKKQSTSSVRYQWPPGEEIYFPKPEIPYNMESYPDVAHLFNDSPGEANKDSSEKKRSRKRKVASAIESARLHGEALKKTCPTRKK